MSLTSFLIVFFALFATDICWSFYIKSVGDSSPLKSALWAVFLFGVGSIATISYVTNPWLVIPALLGAFCGTYLGVWWNGRKK